MTNEPTPSPAPPSSTLALVCGWVCVAAYLWPFLHVMGGTYDGAMSWCLSFLLLIPAIPIGPISAMVALTRSEVTGSSNRRAKWALILIWAPLAIMTLVVFVDSIRRHW